MKITFQQGESTLFSFEFCNLSRCFVCCFSCLWLLCLFAGMAFGAGFTIALRFVNGVIGPPKVIVHEAAKDRPNL